MVHRAIRSIIFICFAIGLKSLSAATADSTAVSDTIVVSARKSISRETVRIADEQRKTGQTDNLNTIISMQPGIQRVAEAGSAFIVHGGGIYDNVYLVNGVPMMEPSHFYYHSFADRSGFLLSSIKNITLIPAPAGRFSNGGSVIAVNPGIARINDTGPLFRPELVAKYGSFDEEITLSTPVPASNALFQLAGRFSNAQAVWWKASAFGGGNSPLSPFVTSDSARLGYSLPESFGDIALTGIFERGAMQSHLYAWLAYDSYAKTRYNPAKMVPWGTVSLSMESNDSSGLKIAFGGSRQQQFSGKRMGWVTPFSQVERNSGAFALESRIMGAGALLFSGGVRGEYLDWSGGSASYWIRSGGVLKDSVSVRNVNGKEMKIELPFSLRYGTSPGDFFTYILFGSRVSSRSNFYADPGFAFVMQDGHRSLQANAGIQTSWPDIRGLPDETYRADPLKTWSGSIKGTWKYYSRATLTADGYTKWMDRCPRFSRNVSEPWWDKSRETHLFTRGCAFSLDLTVIRDRISLWLVEDLNKSERIAGGIKTPFEWDIPWSTSAILKLNPGRNFRFYLKGTFADGLSYQSPDSVQNELVFGGPYRRIPYYRRVDLKIENCQKYNNRFIIESDLYLELINVLNNFEGLNGYQQWYWENIREYYWDNSLKPQPIVLEYATISFGLKLGFKL